MWRDRSSSSWSSSSTWSATKEHMRKQRNMYMYSINEDNHNKLIDIVIKILLNYPIYNR